MDYTMDKFRATVAAEMEDDMIKEQGLAGFGNGKMGYQTTCTREMMVVFLYRLWQKIKAYIDGKVG